LEGGGVKSEEEEEDQEEDEEEDDEEEDDESESEEDAGARLDDDDDAEFFVPGKALYAEEENDLEVAEAEEGMDEEEVEREKEVVGKSKAGRSRKSTFSSSSPPPPRGMKRASVSDEPSSEGANSGVQLGTSSFSSSSFSSFPHHLPFLSLHPSPPTLFLSCVALLFLFLLLPFFLGTPPSHISLVGPMQLPLYSCPVNNCGASYTRNNNLKVHLLTKHSDLDTKSMYTCLYSHHPSLPPSLLPSLLPSFSVPSWLSTSHSSPFLSFVGILKCL